MFELLLLTVAFTVIVGILVAFDGSRDAFHPMMFIGPMLLFLYAWMPYKLLTGNGLDRFFDNDQLVHVQLLNTLGVLAFVVGVLMVGTRWSRTMEPQAPLSARTLKRLLIAAACIGIVGLACWIVTIVTVGGFTAAFGTSYTGGSSDSGYVRDGVMFLLVAVLLALAVLARGGPRVPALAMTIVFAAPWAANALLMGRRGPTFGLAVVLLMGWYMGRGKRPPVLAMAAAGLCLGWLVLFLVTNRQSIYLGSDFDVKTDVGDIVDKPQTGNEFIYGAGTVLSAERRDHYFWMRRYLAQFFVRPVPSSIWPTKYEDFGVPELLYNAGTGEGFGDALGWVGAVGSAPGIIADLWLECWWGAVFLMGCIGWAYATVWKQAVLHGQPWTSVYVLLAALSIYLVMQTGEAMIFRTLELCLPCWFAWRWARRAAPDRRRRRVSSRFARPVSAPTNEVTQHA